MTLSTPLDEERETPMPCPFCGSVFVSARQSSDDDDRWIIACDSKARECPMEITVYCCSNEEGAFAAWNRRASRSSGEPALEREARSLDDYANEVESEMTAAVLRGAAKRLRALSGGIPRSLSEGEAKFLRVMQEDADALERDEFPQIGAEEFRLLIKLASRSAPLPFSERAVSEEPERSLPFRNVLDDEEFARRELGALHGDNE